VAEFAFVHPARDLAPRLIFALAADVVVAAEVRLLNEAAFL
jgi:hypothetical protein